MYRNLMSFCLVAMVAGAAGAADDPYAKLPAIDFGKNDCTNAIVDEVRAAKPADHAAIEAKLLAAASKPEASFLCKQFVAEQLRVVGSKAAVPVVVKWLDDAKTADLAAFALCGLKAPGVDDALLAAARAKQGAVRVGLLNALANRRSNAVINDLIDLTKGQDEEIARFALADLGQIGTPEAVAALKGISVSGSLDNDREQALVAAAYQLAKDGNKPAARSLWQDLYKKSPRGNVAAASLQGLLVLDGSETESLVLASVKDKRTDVAVRAVWLTRSLKGDAVTKALIAALPAVSAAVQAPVLRALGERGESAASLAAVKGLLGAQDEVVRVAAIRACQNLADAATAQSLLAIAGGPAGSAAEAAQDVLGRLKIAGLDEQLLKQLDEPKADAVKVASTVLVARGYRAALPKFLTLAASPDKGIREAALKAADQFVGLKEVPALLALVSKAAPEDREKFARVTWTACRSIMPKEKRFAYLWAQVPPSDHAARLGVIPQAAAAGGNESLKIVQEQIKSADKDMQDLAYRALFAWPDDSAGEAQLAAMKSTENRTYRVLAARSMATRFTDRKATLPLAKRKAIIREALNLLEKPEDQKILQTALTKLDGK